MWLTFKWMFIKVHTASPSWKTEIYSVLKLSIGLQATSKAQYHGSPLDKASSSPSLESQERLGGFLLATNGKGALSTTRVGTPNLSFHLGDW